MLGKINYKYIVTRRGTDASYSDPYIINAYDAAGQKSETPVVHERVPTLIMSLSGDPHLENPQQSQMLSELSTLKQVPKSDRWHGQACNSTPTEASTNDCRQSYTRQQRQQHHQQRLPTV